MLYKIFSNILNSVSPGSTHNCTYNSKIECFILCNPGECVQQKLSGTLNNYEVNVLNLHGVRIYNLNLAKNLELLQLILVVKFQLQEVFRFADSCFL